ncbi:hypothetical protein [Streptomyces sp. NBC_01565]|uniref:hypothetical protein n=1 Tax=Streptomyces sp. NBC_01565 TaxID=2975881 RepID=UPI002B1CD06D|nr:hypothetical protein [Streptomyces sp. NBC_01565]
MTRTTAPRPIDVEALFPGLAGHRRTTTRLHPRPGAPGVRDSHVGGPLLWPADEPWPVCEAPHKRGGGLRPAEIRAARAGLAEPAPRHKVSRLSPADPLPMLAVAQLFARDVPDLPAGPAGLDLLQVFWCPFDRHGPTGHGMHLHLRWRSCAEVREPLAEQPEPELVGSEGYLPEPCVLHPERVTEYEYIELLPGRLGRRVEAWEEDQEEREGAPTYMSDLSIAPGWRRAASPPGTSPVRASCTARPVPACWSRC